MPSNIVTPQFFAVAFSIFFSEIILILIVNKFKIKFSPLMIILWFFVGFSFLGILFMDYSLSGIGFFTFNREGILSGLYYAIILHFISFFVMAAPCLLINKSFKCTKTIKILNSLSYVPAWIILMTTGVLLLLATLSLLLVYSKTGIIPLLSENPLMAKHYEGVEGFQKIKPFVFISQQLASFSIFSSLLNIFGYFDSKKKYKIISIFFLSVGVILLVLQLKRGPLLLPFLIVGGGMLLSRRIKPIKFFSIISLLIGVAIFFWILKREFSFDLIMFALSMSIGVELRELARIIATFLTANGLDPALGKTYLASICSFIPSSIFSFKQTYHLGMYTNNYLAYPEGVLSGSPRIFYIGEAFLNFGFVGSIFVSISFGMFLKYIEDIYKKLKDKGDDVRLIFLFFIIYYGIAFLTSGSIVIQNIIIFGIWIFFILLSSKAILSFQTLIKNERTA